jgi:hypothetical protein
MDELDTKSVDVSVCRAPEKMRRQDDGNEQENATCRRSHHCILIPTGLLVLPNGDLLLPLLQRALIG